MKCPACGLDVGLAGQKLVLRDGCAYSHCRVCGYEKKVKCR